MDNWILSGSRVCLSTMKLLSFTSSVLSVAIGILLISNDGNANIKPDDSNNPCHDLTQQETDECYMRLALNYALANDATSPFGALIVDHTTNEISCYGANSSRKNKLLHGIIFFYLNNQYIRVY